MGSVSWVGSIPIVSLRPVSSGTTLWRGGGALQITVVVKATFGMMHEGSARLIAPQPLVIEDRCASTGSLAEPSDMAPYLPGAGIVVSGHAHAPRPTAAITVRLAVYRERPLVDKALHVFGDRAPGAPAPTPFQSMPITYERAHGGAASADNPVGVAPDGRAQPNVIHPDDPRRPAGFGPIASHWTARRRLLSGRPAPASEPGAEIAEGFDFRWFQAAPADQQCDYLQGDEWIVLDGMHPALPRLQTRLPDAHAEAVWVAPGPRGPQGHRLALRADTLSIDADRQICSLVWRAHFALDHAELLPQLGIFTGVSMAGYPITWPDEAHLDGELGPPSGPDHAPTEKIVVGGVRAPALPFSKVARPEPAPLQTADSSGEKPELNATITTPLISPFASALPFQPSAPGTLPAPAAPPRPAFSDTDTATTSPFLGGLPFAPARGAAPSASSARVAAPSSVWANDDTEDRTRMIDPAAVAAISRKVPFAMAEPNTVEPRAATPLPGAPWSAATEPSIQTSAPGSETIVARASDLLLPPLPAPRAPLPPLPPIAPPPIAAARISAAPLPPITPPPIVGRKIPAPPVAPPPIVGAQTISAPLPPLPLPPAPPITPPPPIARPRAPSEPPPAAALPAAAEPPAAVETGLRATVLSRAKAREVMRDLPLAGADLHDLDLSGARLDGLDLRGAKLTRCRLVEARLLDARLTDADLTEADLTRADLTRADLSRAALGLARFDDASLHETNLTGAHGHGASFTSARAPRARFAGGEWDGATFTSANLTSADLTGASLAGARFVSATLIEARLTDTRGRGAVFDDARLDQVTAGGAALASASFRRADAPGSIWEDATLDEACFAGARLGEANLSRASCARTDFTGAELGSANLSRLTGDGARFDDARMASVDLRQARLRDASFVGVSARGLLAGKADLTGSRFTRADLEGATLRAARLGGVSFAHGNLDGADLRDADLDHTNVFGASRKATKIGARGVVEIDPEAAGGS